MSQESKMNSNKLQITKRREFMKQVFFFAGAGLLANTFIRTKAFAAEPQLIDMTGKKRTDADNKECVATATSIGYVDDLDAAIKAKKITKTAGQDCQNCMFYNYKKANPAQPTCQLIPKCLVQPKGSCNSWTKKA